jgi:hypothetical protein
MKAKKAKETRRKRKGNCIGPTGKQSKKTINFIFHQILYPGTMPATATDAAIG